MEGIPHNFPEFVQYGFYTLLSAAVLFHVNTLKKLQQNVQQIGVLLATFEERFKGVDHRLERLEDSRDH